MRLIYSGFWKDKRTRISPSPILHVPSRLSHSEPAGQAGRGSGHGDGSCRGAGPSPGLAFRETRANPRGRTRGTPRPFSETLAAFFPPPLFHLPGWFSPPFYPPSMFYFSLRKGKLRLRICGRQSIIPEKIFSTFFIKSSRCLSLAASPPSSPFSFPPLPPRPSRAGCAQPKNQK